MNLAETGVEEALWSFNQATAGVAVATAWNGWNTTDSVHRQADVHGFQPAEPRPGQREGLRRSLRSAQQHAAKVIAQATITIPNESRMLTKWVELTLRRRSKFAMGLVAKNQIISAATPRWSTAGIPNSTTTARPAPVRWLCDDQQARSRQRRQHLRRRGLHCRQQCGHLGLRVRRQQQQ